MRKPIIIGNWKMNKNSKETVEFIEIVEKNKENLNIEAGIGVPFVNLSLAKQSAKKLIIAAQNCHFEDSGAYTGEISVDMLKDLGITHAIIGHSERREMFNETDETVNKKAIKLLNKGLVPILCCGETLTQYESGQTIEVVTNQIKKALQNITASDVEKIVIAYEPIWAIGTGKTATSEIAEEVCKVIRNVISELYDQNVANKVRIQYGGSVKPSNIKELLAQPNIDGALVGGASLDPVSFIELIK